MRLKKEQKDMLRAYGKHTTGIAWIDWIAAPMVRAKYLTPIFSFDGEIYYGITRLGKSQVSRRTTKAPRSGPFH